MDKVLDDMFVLEDINSDGQVNFEEFHYKKTEVPQVFVHTKTDTVRHTQRNAAPILEVCYELRGIWSGKMCNNKSL